MPRAYGRLFILQGGNSAGFLHSFVTDRTGDMGYTFGNVRHFLEVLDELNHLNVEFVSLRENIDTGGPLGRAMFVIVGAIAELEKSLIVERVKAGMRRARLEGRHLGRRPLNVDRTAIVRDRLSGLGLTEVAKRASSLQSYSLPFGQRSWKTEKYSSAQPYRSPN
jgi:DNA invertase Pin-like site-specific DNA recombinase